MTDFSVLPRRLRLFQILLSRETSIILFGDSANDDALSGDAGFQLFDAGQIGAGGKSMGLDPSGDVLPLWGVSAPASV